MLDTWAAQASCIKDHVSSIMYQVSRSNYIMTHPISPERMRGVLSPVVTPFDRELRPDGERLINHCRWLLEQGVGLAVFGTNSEANSMSVAEKIALLDALIAAGIPPTRMMPGTGTSAIPDTVELTRHAV